jgi:hypothetical protein
VDCGAGLSEAIPRIGLHQPGRNAQQGRLAGAVAPDQADPVVGRNGQLRAGKQGVTPKVTLMSCRKGRGSGIAKEISRVAPSSGVFSVCQIRRQPSGRFDGCTAFLHRLTVRSTQAPFSRWAFHHARELAPSAEIVNDPGDVHEWPIDPRDIGAIPIEADGVRPLSFDEFLFDTSTRAPTASSSPEAAGSSSSDTPMIWPKRGRTS